MAPARLVLPGVADWGLDWGWMRSGSKELHARRAASHVVEGRLPMRLPSVGRTWPALEAVETGCCAKSNLLKKDCNQGRAAD